MDQPYSFWADLLNKFHTSSELIQALWLVMGPLTLLGMTWLVLRGIRDILHAARRDRDFLIDGVSQDAQGCWMVYRHNRQPQEIDRAYLPELIGREPSPSRRTEE